MISQESGTSCFSSGSLWRERSACRGELELPEPPSGAVYARLLFTRSAGKAPRAAEPEEAAPKSLA